MAGPSDVIWKWQFSFGITTWLALLIFQMQKATSLRTWGMAAAFKWKKQTPLPSTEVVAKTLQIARDKRNQTHN